MIMALATGRTLLLLLIATGLSAATPTEYEVKAAFIYNFTKYVQWPPPGSNADEPFVIGVLGKDPFGLALDEVMGGQSVQRRVIVVRRFSRIEDAAKSHVLFVCASERPHLRRIFEALRNAPVLTVGDMGRFAELGGMINLTTEENRVRFEMNPNAIQRAGLKAGSPLFRLGRIVKESPMDK